MTTIVTKANSKSYAIYVNRKKIVECNSPITTYNELIKNLGIDTTNVSIIEHHSFPLVLDGTSISNQNILQEVIDEVIDEKTNIDDIILNINNTIIAPNLSKYKENHHFVLTTEETTEEIIDKKYSETQTNEPVGAVDCPKLGDLVYVNGMDGILRKVTAGVGSISGIFHSNDEIDMNTPIIEQYDEESGELYINENTEKNILIEIEEAPGVYFSWSLLRELQNDLKTKYGYKPAKVIGL